MIIGLVGKPNVGKSTFFKAATLSDVLIANYPFATIKPNHGMGYVKIHDLAADFGKVSNPRQGYVREGHRFVPIDLFDVAGLVEGASEGKGLGNQFLDDLAGVDDVIHVVLKGKFDITRPALWSDETLFNFARSLRVYTKPMIIAANKVDRPNGKTNFNRVKEKFAYPIIACFADGELSLRQADKAGMIKYIPG